MCENCKNKVALELAITAAVNRVLDNADAWRNSLAFTIQQASVATGLTPKAIQNAISCRELPAKKLRGKWVITREHLVRWLS